MAEHICFETGLYFPDVCLHIILSSFYPLCLECIIFLGGGEANENAKEDATSSKTAQISENRLYGINSKKHKTVDATKTKTVIVNSSVVLVLFVKT